MVRFTYNRAQYKKVATKYIGRWAVYFWVFAGIACAVAIYITIFVCTLHLDRQEASKAISMYGVSVVILANGFIFLFVRVAQIMAKYDVISTDGNVEFQFDWEEQAALRITISNGEMLIVRPAEITRVIKMKHDFVLMCSTRCFFVPLNSETAELKNQFEMIAKQNKK